MMIDQGGDLWVESREGGGTSFGLCLPLAKSVVPNEPVDEPVGRTA
jgi:signal transduction histidine kinase